MKQSGYTYDMDIYWRIDRKGMAVDMTATQVTEETLDKEETWAEAEAAWGLLFIAPLIWDLTARKSNVVG